MSEPRKRLLHRCTHMGMKENDVLFGGFARTHLNELSIQEVDDLSAVLINVDPVLFEWASGKVALPAKWDTPVMRKLIKYNAERL